MIKVKGITISKILYTILVLLPFLIFIIVAIINKGHGGATFDSILDELTDNTLFNSLTTTALGTAILTFTNAVIGNNTLSNLLSNILTYETFTTIIFVIWNIGATLILLLIDQTEKFRERLKMKGK